MPNTKLTDSGDQWQPNPQEIGSPLIGSVSGSAAALLT
jgi:hypothetical protein